jgi:ABC-type microcin C transport system permease subunit YejE
MPAILAYRISLAYSLAYTLRSLSINVRAGNGMDSFSFTFNGGLITLARLTIDEIQSRISFGGGKQMDAIFMIR